MDIDTRTSPSQTPDSVSSETTTEFQLRHLDSPTGRVTSLEATFPARAKSGFWNDSNHSSVSLGEVSVKKSPVGPFSFYSREKSTRKTDSVVSSGLVLGEDASRAWRLKGGTNGCDLVEISLVLLLSGGSKSLGHDLVSAKEDSASAAGKGHNDLSARAQQCRRI